MLKNGKTGKNWCLKADGCSCCNTPQQRRSVKKGFKRREERSWKMDQRNN